MPLNRPLVRTGRSRLRGFTPWSSCSTRSGGLIPPTPAPGLGPPLPHLHWDWAHPCHRCTGAELAPATPAPGLGPPLPHLHRDWAHPRHRCTGTELAPATSAPGLGYTGAGLTPPTSAPGLGSPLLAAPAPGARSGSPAKSTRCPRAPRSACAALPWWCRQPRYRSIEWPAEWLPERFRLHRVGRRRKAVSAQGARAHARVCGVRARVCARLRVRVTCAHMGPRMRVCAWLVREGRPETAAAHPDARMAHARPRT
jgi:hypothetical protein